MAKTADLGIQRAVTMLRANVGSVSRIVYYIPKYSMISSRRYYRLFVVSGRMQHQDGPQETQPLCTPYLQEITMSLSTAANMPLRKDGISINGDHLDLAYEIGKIIGFEPTMTSLGSSCV